MHVLLVSLGGGWLIVGLLSRHQVSENVRKHACEMAKRKSIFRGKLQNQQSHKRASEEIMQSYIF